MEKVNREFQIFAKPVGALCNLRCKYCYYLEKRSLYYGEESLTMNDEIPKGWFIVSYKGISLGFCNNIGTRVNNYFPVDLRIRMSIPKEGPKNIILWVG